MKKLQLDLDSLCVETFATAPDVARDEMVVMQHQISRKSCIEQCTPTCVP
jgi:hypothetical protein